ncbi:MAG: hypothetical protein ABII09_11825 [Planctomycetota bacterium]
MAKHTEKPAGPQDAFRQMDGKSLSPQKGLAELLRRQFPQIFTESNEPFIYPDRFKEEKDDYELRWRQPSHSGAGIKDAKGLLTKDRVWGRMSGQISKNIKIYAFHER